MQPSKQKKLIPPMRIAFGAIALTAGTLLDAQDTSADALKEQVASLRQQLAEAEANLERARLQESEATDRAEKSEAQLAQAADTGPSKIEIGNFKIGGAIRANYVFGDYDKQGDASRGEDGTIQLDVFRINVDYEKGPVVGKFEYRWYPGYRTNNSDSYNFIHTGWLGYNLEDGGQVQVGVNRVPFGPGAYGISQSWFFDQHFYMGLADDMDLGVKYSNKVGNLSYDVAYYYSDEGSANGEYFSSDSVRYSYDVVDETGMGYEERNQFNARGIYQVGDTAIGGSIQYGELKSNGVQDDGSLFAVSGHMVNQMGNLKLASQVTYYSADIDAAQPLGTDELIQMGAYDFASLAASEAWILGASLSYYHETPNLDWLDYIIPYVEYSTIQKSATGFNSSDLFVFGAAWGRGGWYIYTDAAFSNGNDFIGNEGGYGANPAPGFSSNRHGANPNDDWQFRFNTNFGYYF
jgi:hypothetical protein